MSQVRNALSARSVMASILLGMRRPELPGADLLACGELFGISAGTCRVALSRMVGAGELDAEGGTYRLTGALRARQARQEEGRRPSLRPWDRTWVIALVPSEARPAAARASLRAAMSGLRLAELRDGVWLRPDNIEGWRARVAGPDATSGPNAAPASSCRWFAGALDDLDRGDPRELVARLWPLEEWAQRAAQLRTALGASLPELEQQRPEALAPTFGVAADAIRHLAVDPLLPDQLLPARWPGEGLRADYDRYRRAFQAALRVWMDRRR
ncbi:MAG: PaaX family transcriptional regulator C-terminal domain-containing protein [Acidimicrobiales bacterium]